MTKKSPTIFLFLLSPFLSVFSIFVDVYNRKKSGLVFLALFIGILTYLYLPNVAQDGAKRYYLYESFTTMSLDYFINYFLAFRVDFIFYILIYAFAQIGIKYQILLFILGTFNGGIPLFLFWKLTKNKKITQRMHFAYFLLIVSTYSIVYLFSGIRQLVGFSFVEMGVYHLFFSGKKTKGYVWLLFAPLIHFSAIIYLPLIFLYKNSNKFLFVTVLVTGILVLNILTPQRVQSLFMGATDIQNDVVDSKVGAYIVSSSLGEKTRTGLTAVARVLKSAWFYVSILYLFITHKTMKSNFRRVHYLLMAPVLLFFAFPGIYGRYIYLTQVSFGLLLIYESMHGTRSGWITVFIILFFFTPLYEALRHVTDSLVAGYFRFSNLTLIQILNSSYSYSDMLR